MSDSKHDDDNPAPLHVADIRAGLNLSYIAGGMSSADVFIRDRLFWSTDRQDREKIQKEYDRWVADMVTRELMR